MDQDPGSDALAYIQRWCETRKETGWWHSFELPDGRILQGVSTLEAQKMRIAQFPIPADLSGKRVLDIGTWDGWFAFEMERRGAEVLAIDRWENARFYLVQEMLNSRVEYRQMSVYDLDPGEIGRFDLVLFMGVLYHLKHPMLALERVASVAKDLAAVESFVLKDRHRPGLSVEDYNLLEFYEEDEFGGQFDNWFAPTDRCLAAMCRAAGFVRVELKPVHEFGSAVICHRTWPTPVESPKGATHLTLAAACHADNYGMNFQSRSSDEYVACRVAVEGPELTRHSVWPEAGGYGALPIFVGRVEDHWQVNFKLPPGLPPGWHSVRLRTPGAVSNSLEIAVDIPALADALRMTGICDGVTWEFGCVSLANGFVSLWVEGLPRNADVGNVKVLLAGRRKMTTFVGEANPGKATQINVALDPGTPLGTQCISVVLGRAEASGTVDVTR